MNHRRKFGGEIITRSKGLSFGESDGGASAGETGDDGIVDTMVVTLWAMLRELEVTVDVPGFRTESLVVVTSLFDHQIYTHADISALYRRRWVIELELRDIQTTMDLGVLRRQTPESVRQELWTGLLAYNLVRQSLLQSAQASGCQPHQLSFASALQMLANTWVLAAVLNDSPAAAAGHDQRPRTPDRAAHPQRPLAPTGPPSEPHQAPRGQTPPVTTGPAHRTPLRRPSPPDRRPTVAGVTATPPAPTAGR